jgi:hypothetical protein
MELYIPRGGRGGGGRNVRNKNIFSSIIVYHISQITFFFFSLCDAESNKGATAVVSVASLGNIIHKICEWKNTQRKRNNRLVTEDTCIVLLKFV